MKQYIAICSTCKAKVLTWVFQENIDILKAAGKQWWLSKRRDRVRMALMEVARIDLNKRNLYILEFGSYNLYILEFGSCYTAMVN